MADRIVVVAYDPAWPGEFEAESQRIDRALGDLVVALHHIGSTAIPGMFAKPILDMLLEAGDLAGLDRETEALQALGYEAMGEFGIPRRRYFRKSNQAGVRTHHLHAFQVGDAEIERHLAFRDYLIAHPAAAQAYGALKRELARCYADDREAYVDGKDAFVKEHEARALRWRRGG